MTERVSVIIPAFNSAPTIATTLRSVIKQTYGDWEIVIGDDGSTDGTSDLARAVSPRVRVVRAQTNHGPAAARNLAIAQAHGRDEYVPVDDVVVAAQAIALAILRYTGPAAG